jgi:hypothetical protein
VNLLVYDRLRYDSVFCARQVFLLFCFVHDRLCDDYVLCMIGYVMICARQVKW